MGAVQLIAIAIGGAVGALLRYGVSLAAAAVLGRGFPFGTLVVNVLGCLLMGVLYVLLLERMAAAAEWRAALLVGVLGAFTTFSTFSMETLVLFENGEQVRAFVNITASVVLCLAATWAGVLLGRSL